MTANEGRRAHIPPAALRVKPETLTKQKPAAGRIRYHATNEKTKRRAKS